MMNHIKQDRGRDFWLGVFANLAICLAIYGQTLSYSFLYWDDQVQINHNSLINPPTASKIESLWKKPYFGLYIPLTYTLWTMVAQVSNAVHGSPDTGNPRGLDPALFHALNVILHLLNSLGVFFLLRFLFPGRTLGALAGGLLFAAHPLQVEPVAWVSGTRDLLAAFFALLASWQYLKSVEIDSPEPATWPYLAATAAFTLSLLAKPSAVTLPFILAAIQFFLQGRRSRACLRGLLTWALIALPFIFLSKQVQPDQHLDYLTPIWQRPLIAGDSLFFYLHKLVWPGGLTSDYGRLPAQVTGDPWSYAGAALAGSALGVAWRLRRRAPGLAAGMAVFLLGLLPVLGLIPFEFQSYSTVADRYTYLALLGPALTLSYFVDRFGGSTAVRAGIFAALAALALRAFIQVPVWANDRALFTHALQHNPASFVAESSLGLMEFEAGHGDEAIAHYQAALRLNPDYFLARNNLASTYMARKEFKKEIEQLEILVSKHPNNAGLQVNLGLALAHDRQTAEGIRHLETALELDPGLNEVRSNIAMLLLEEGKTGEAVARLREASRRDPGNPYLTANLKAAEREAAASAGASRPPQNGPAAGAAAAKGTP